MNIETVLGCLPLAGFILMIFWAVWQALNTD